MRHADRLGGIFDHPPAISSGQRRVNADLVQRDQQVLAREVERGIGIVEIRRAKGGESFVLFRFTVNAQHLFALGIFTFAL